MGSLPGQDQRMPGDFCWARLRLYVVCVSMDPNPTARQAGIQKMKSGGPGSPISGHLPLQGGMSPLLALALPFQ